MFQRLAKTKLFSKVTELIDGKNLKNGLWLYLLQFFNTILPLITVPYVASARVLGQAGYGTFSIALNIITYLQVLIEYGFGMSATREVAVSEKDTRMISRIFTSVLLARLILFGLSILIAIGYLFFRNASSVLWLSMMVMLVCLLGYCTQQNWLFQGMQEMKYISIINILSRSISTVLIFIMVKTGDDIVKYSLLYSISPLLAGFSGCFIAVRRYGLRLVRVTIHDVLDELKKGWYVFTTQFSSKVFGGIGLTFLGVLSTEVVAGTFAAIQKIPNIMMLAWMPISQVLYPLISKDMKESYSKGRKKVVQFQKFFIPLFILLAVLISFFSKTIVGVFGKEYADYSYWVIPLLIWFVLAINNNFLGIQTLLASGHDKEYSICFQISVACTVVINFVLVYFFGGDGAALAPAISEAILFFTLLYQVKKLKGNE